MWFFMMLKSPTEHCIFFLVLLTSRILLLISRIYSMPFIHSVFRFFYIYFFCSSSTRIKLNGTFVSKCFYPNIRWLLKISFRFIIFYSLSSLFFLFLFAVRLLLCIAVTLRGPNGNANDKIIGQIKINDCCVTYKIYTMSAKIKLVGIFDNEKMF